VADAVAVSVPAGIGSSRILPRCPTQRALVQTKVMVWSSPQLLAPSFPCRRPCEQRCAHAAGSASLGCWR
jgi:hypothetical protein